MGEKVVIYSAPGCNTCLQAKQLLTEKEIPFETVDVTSGPNALDEMKRVSGGARTVPVISVCGKVLVGFDRAALEKALECL
jgi:glutaredoxin 3